MVHTNSFHYPSADGIHQIYAAEWLPEGQPRGVVQIVHGISEYVERYDRFARFLAGQGFVVCGEDHLGHGRTGEADGEFGYFAESQGWDKVLTDIHALRESMRADYPGLPYFLFGHSMGSFLTRHYLLRWPGSVSGAILSGTGQEPEAAIRAGRALTSALVRMGKGKGRSRLVLAMSLGAYNRAFRPNRTRVDWICRDEAVQDAYLADPFCRFVPTTGMFHDMLGGLLVIGDPGQLSAMEKSTPVFFLSGDHDPVGQMGKGVVKVYDLFKTAGCADVTLKLYKDGRHEMLNEFNYEQVHRDILEWLEKNLKSLKKTVDFNAKKC